MWETKKPVVESGTQTSNSCHKLDYARGNKSICTFQLSMQVRRKIIYVSKKSTHLHVDQQCAPKRSKFSVTNTQEKPEDFFYGTTQALTLAPTIILLT